MAKETKVATPAVAKDNVDSVMDEIRSKNIMPKNLSKEVKADIEKEDKEKKKSELKQAIQHASYHMYYALLELKKRRKEAIATKASLEKISSFVDRLSGVTRDGKDIDEKDVITLEQYKDLYRKLKEEDRKAQNEIEIESRNCIKELNNTDCARYSDDWWLRM